MAVSLKHAKTSAVADGGNTDLVQPSDWNSEHTLTLATDKLLGRVTAGTGAAEEVTCTDFAQSLLDDADATAARATLGLGTLATQSGTFSGTSSGTNTGDQNLFSTIAVSGQSNVVADAASDTLTLAAGTNIAITTNATTDTVTIATSGLGSLATASTINDSNWSGTDLAVANGGTGASTAADARTNLGLVIGTNVQAYDAELAAIAGLTSAANKVPYFTGSGTAALVDATPGTWNAWTPTIAAAPATSFTSVVAWGRWARFGNIVVFGVLIIITTNGTASGYITATLPHTTSASNYTGCAGRCYAISGKLVGGTIGASSGVLGIQSYDGTYPGADGEGIMVFGHYEI